MWTLGRPWRRRLFTVPRNKDLKRLVRARMAETGENYTSALAGILGETELEPLPEPWKLTGSRATDYQVGLLPGTETYEGKRIVLLRSRPDEMEFAGFGAFMQSIRATRYLGRRVQFSAMARTEAASGWGGLWLRVDGPGGTAALDNMQDRPLKETTGWTLATIVMDVPSDARSLSFGALLSGAGALQVSGPRFAPVDQTVPVTTRPFGESLPEEPQALDF
jgi:hypothetical protein